jgi:hypothetical protein
MTILVPIVSLVNIKILPTKQVVKTVQQVLVILPPVPPHVPHVLVQPTKNMYLPHVL